VACRKSRRDAALPHAGVEPHPLHLQMFPSSSGLGVLNGRCRRGVA
jgi:hypothetical protein